MPTSGRVINISVLQFKPGHAAGSILPHLLLCNLPGIRIKGAALKLLPHTAPGVACAEYRRGKYHPFASAPRGDHIGGFHWVS